MQHRLTELIQQFDSKSVLVVGDVIADVYLIGTTSRISREAPVLILDFESERIFLGGAGNAANNVRACGATTMLAGVVGSDARGEAVRAELESVGVDGRAVLALHGMQTAVKTRILAGGRHTTRQQIVRVDHCPTISLSRDEQSELAGRIREAAQQAHAIVISDYGHGLVAHGLFEVLLGLARDRQIPIAVDARYDTLKYAGVTAQTPNETELEEILGVPLQMDERRLVETGTELRHRLSLGSLLVTRGSKGMMLFHEGGHHAIPIYGSDEVADVTGAGDTVIGVFTLSLACGASPIEAATLANIAGGLVVMKRGTATVSAEELEDAVLAFGQHEEA